MRHAALAVLVAAVARAGVDPDAAIVDAAIGDAAIGDAAAPDATAEPDASLPVAACDSDQDCADEPKALGPTCGEDGACHCDSQLDCLGNAHGPICDDEILGCVCLGDVDCVSQDATCVLGKDGVGSCSGPAAARPDGSAEGEPDAGAAITGHARDDGGSAGADEESGGCGCRFAGREAPPTMALAIVALLLARRTRRAARARA